MNLKQAAVSGVKWTSISTFLVSLFQLAQLAVLSRFLSPEEFGLIAILMVVIGFSQAFIDMGLSNAIIQRPEVSRNQLASLYWLNLGAGLILSGIVILLAPTIASFFEQPELIGPVGWIGLSFFIIAIGNQYKVLCQKHFHFSLIAKVEVLSGAAALLVVVVAAANGLSIYAMVLGLLCQVTFSTTIFFWAGCKRFYPPRWYYSHAELTGFISFGAYQMGERLVNFLGSNLDKVIIGRLVGMDQLGHYNLAWQLSVFPNTRINPVINRVAFPVYSRLKGDTEGLNRYYRTTVQVLCLLTVPILVFLALYAQDVIKVVFGPGWDLAGQVLVGLAFVGIYKAFSNPGGAILTALGYANVCFWWNVGWSAVVIIAVFLTLKFSQSVLAVPIALLSCMLTVGLIWHVLIAKLCRIHYLPIVINFLKILFVCLMLGLISVYIVNQLAIGVASLRIVVATGLLLPSYVFYLYFFERLTLKLIRSL